ncbi:hypothetical protein AB0896_13425 [Streptomyces parvulus]|uniref:hypothetical protein n=1 Tax=Streptomyces parvulus TaxID=146923 RepID=UPI00345557E3
MSSLPRARDLARPVRAPAALSVPGDVLAGTAATRLPLRPEPLAMVASSVRLSARVREPAHRP